MEMGTPALRLKPSQIQVEVEVEVELPLLEDLGAKLFLEKAVHRVL